MTSTDWPAVWAAVAAGGSVASAGVSAVAAWLARRSAMDANATATTLAQIEWERRSSEVTPRFEVRLTRYDRYTLEIILKGPIAVEQVHDVTLAVAGPLHLVDAVGKPFDHGTAAFGRFSVGDAVAVFLMRPSSLARESVDPFSRRAGDSVSEAPVRATLTCRHSVYGPWMMPFEIQHQEMARGQAITVNLPE
jgi:hypothetical protein